MSAARWLVGDVFERLAEIPDGYVDLVVTSPPFLKQRSYLPDDHPLKHLEIGSEANPPAFLSVMLALTREWRRVLAPHGSIAVELGDKYAGSGGTGGDYDDDGFREGQPRFGRTDGAGWPSDKSLCMLPALYSASLAYGRNLLDPDDTIDPWRVRNHIVWHRPNPRPSTSYVTVACVSDKRWFDLDAERTDLRPRGGDSRPGGKRAQAGVDAGTWSNNGNPAGAPPLDCWTIPTQPYKGAHYAPVALPRKLINLMCPRSVCVVCGEPRRRIVETEQIGATRNGDAVAKGRKTESPAHAVRTEAHVTTLGWTDCGHDPEEWRRGLVLDPFAGSGTTLVAACELGRDSIGIDLDERNLDLARERVGLFLETEVQR